VGLDANWKNESGFITRLVDKLPFFDTKETSNIEREWRGCLFDPRPQQGHW
jgi:hypothetical protein